MKGSFDALIDSLLDYAENRNELEVIKDSFLDKLQDRRDKFDRRKKMQNTHDRQTRAAAEKERRERYSAYVLENVYPGCWVRLTGTNNRGYRKVLGKDKTYKRLKCIQLNWSYFDKKYVEGNYVFDYDFHKVVEYSEDDGKTWKKLRNETRDNK